MWHSFSVIVNYLFSPNACQSSSLFSFFFLVKHTKCSWATARGPELPLHKVWVKYLSAALDHICMQLSAEETLFCKPANYTRVAAADAFKVVCVQMRAITFVCARSFVWCFYIPAFWVLQFCTCTSTCTSLPVFISMLRWYLCTCTAFILKQTFMSSYSASGYGSPSLTMLNHGRIFGAEYIMRL